MYVHMYMYMHVFLCARIYAVCVSVFIRVYVYVKVLYMCIAICARMYTCTCMYAGMHVYLISIHIYIYIYMQIHVYVGTCTAGMLQLIILAYGSCLFLPCNCLSVGVNAQVMDRDYTLRYWATRLMILQPTWVCRLAVGAASQGTDLRAVFPKPESFLPGLPCLGDAR